MPSSFARRSHEQRRHRHAKTLSQTPKRVFYFNPDLVEAAIRVPRGVIVLLSVLNFHGLGFHPAWVVWRQLPAKFPRPRLQHPPLHIIRGRCRRRLR